MTKQADSSRPEWVRAAVEQFDGPLIRFAVQLCGDLDRARDAVQETFLRLCAEQPERVEGHLAEWLFAVCRSRANDARRKERRMSTLTGEHIDSIEHPSAGPEREMERREEVSAVLRELGSIPGNQQEVIRLKFQNGFSYREISSITGHSISNVGFLIHTGLKTIRERLGVEPLVRKS